MCGRIFIFYSVPIERKIRLSFPDSGILKTINRWGNVTHTKKGTSVDCNNATDLLGKDTS